METKQQNKTNGRKTTNDAWVMLLRAGVIAAMLVLGAGTVAGAFPADWTYSDLITIPENSGSDFVDYQTPVELNAYTSPEPTLIIRTTPPQQSGAWTRWGYDLAQTHYYPYPSTTLVSITDFSESWSIPSSASVLTEDINADG